MLADFRHQVLNDDRFLKDLIEFFFRATTINFVIIEKYPEA